MKVTSTLALVAAIAFLSVEGAQAANISGTISSTLTITTDTTLTGDVTCTVIGAPCIQFGASNIELNLHGHTMTGRGSRNICTPTAGEDGIFTNGENGVSITGPGIVRRFQQRGIHVTGSKSIVNHVTVISSCLEGILVGGASNRIEENSVARSSLFGGFDPSIWVQGTGNHTIWHNEISAAGFFNNILGVPPFPAGGGHGIFVGFADGSLPSKNNLIEANNSSGMPGAGLFIAINSTGNRVIRNQFLGNLIFDDVFDPNAVGANTYNHNLCEVSRVGPALTTNICGVPDISGHGNPDGEDEQGQNN